MYKTLRGESMKCVLPRLIICALIAVALLAVSGSGLLRLASGPKDLKSVSTDQLRGSYVRFDASEVIVAFASLSSNGESGSTTLETYYLLPTDNGMYMAVMDAREHNKNLLDRAMEQSHAYYMGDLESLTKLGMVSGTVSELDEEMLGYMSDCIDNYELPGYEEGRDSQRLLLSYQVNLGKVGFLTNRTALIIGIAALFLFILLVLQLVVVLTGCYQKKVRNVVGDEEESAFESAVSIERVRVGKYIWYNQGPGSRAIPTQNLIWGYAMPEPMVVSKYRWPVALYDRDQNLTRINFMEPQKCQDFLDAIAAQGYPFHVGYTSDLAEQFRNDYIEFQKLAEQEAKARTGSSD